MSSNVPIIAQVKLKNMIFINEIVIIVHVNVIKHTLNIGY